MANLIERREYTPKRFYAGEFPVVTETGIRNITKRLDGTFT